MSDFGGFTGLFVLLIILGIAIGISLLIGNAAERKGRSKWAFFWLSLLLAPLGTIVMAIIAATIAPLPPKPAHIPPSP